MAGWNRPSVSIADRSHNNSRSMVSAG
jgi:hypothetical protein